MNTDDMNITVVFPCKRLLTRRVRTIKADALVLVPAVLIEVRDTAEQSITISATSAMCYFMVCMKLHRWRGSDATCRVLVRTVATTGNGTSPLGFKALGPDFIRCGGEELVISGNFSGD